MRDLQQRLIRQLGKIIRAKRGIMKTDNTSRILGLAFLLQFITSLASAMILRATWFVAENMSETLVKIATNSLLMRVNILFDVLTALGIVFLGSMLFITVRKQNEKMA